MHHERGPKQHDGTGCGMARAGAPAEGDGPEPQAETGSRGLVDRRAFLHQAGALGLCLAGAGVLGSACGKSKQEGPPPPPPHTGRMFDMRVAEEAAAPLLATVQGGDRGEAVRRAVEALGGMGRFVKPGEAVLVKPNIAWDKLEIHGADTNPQVVGAVVRLCKEAGAGRVVVADLTCNDPQRCYERSGIWKAAEDAGAEIFLPQDQLESVDLGGVLGTWKVNKLAFEVQRIINVPVVKQHGGSKVTAGMKNWYGMLEAVPRGQLHGQMNEGIADLAWSFRPSLTVIDATRVMVRNGPEGGSVNDVEMRNQLAAATDVVAADVWAAGLLGLSVADVGYLKLAERAGLGTTELPKGRRQDIVLSAVSAASATLLRSNRAVFVPRLPHR
jgi:uncharacterized protein (DUF362 family)